MDTVLKRLEALRKRMDEVQADYFLCVTGDPHGSEYIADHYKTREYLSGFTGSNGTLLIGKKDAYLWTDGRYFVQAEKELEGSGITLMRDGDEGVPKPAAFIKEKLKAGDHLHTDGRVLSSGFGMEIADAIKKKRVMFITDTDLAGDIWKKRPEDSARPIRILPDKLTGRNTEDKIQKLSVKIKDAGAASHVITSLEEQMWLFNLRGDDIKCTPVAYSYTVINGKDVYLYLKKEAISKKLLTYLEQMEICVKPYEIFYEDLERMQLKAPILIDPSSLNFRIYQILRMKGKLTEAVGPVTRLKSVKNSIEIKHLKDIYIKDSLVLARFLRFIKENAAKKKINEYEAALMLDRMRAGIKGFNGLSFPTISAFGANAAMMHYEAPKEDSAVIKEGSLYLVDSGGQYDGGTTDVTRTLFIGDVNRKQKRHFTRVVIAMLRLQNAIFLKGCTGENLDVIAREPIWQMGMDYKCGTGHGVGYMLGVHEGPAAIRWRMNAKKAAEPILPGMTLSNEPGVYVAGSHGIRIENIELCEEIETNEDGTFLHFVPLTYVPIDLDGILKDEMQPADIEMLNNYHAAVCDKLMPFMEGDDVMWLKEATRAI
ncbi:MAG: aminopeptidase P family protein [Lachnospiraceae bacterium]|nr:aminopeptidase P family protein [Lachnospiraceae bacterium]